MFEEHPLTQPTIFRLRHFGDDAIECLDRMSGVCSCHASFASEKLSSDPATFREAYLEHYSEVREVLRERLPHLREGKDGFRPPF